VSGIEFTSFGKVARMVGDMTVTEKLDGTNAAVGVTFDGTVFAQSRNRIITPTDDNYGFAAWVRDNTADLLTLGPGVHFGEWWGQGIQRKYGLDERRFSLFNVDRWTAERPACCHVVPILYVGPFCTSQVLQSAFELTLYGSDAAPGFTNPEGVMVWLHNPRIMLKHPFDPAPKGTA
jgi:hypothetical protein